jgi:hypothetical protein
MFRPGQRVEFWSPEFGGRWKPGKVQAVLGQGGNSRRRHHNARIETGPGVWVVRPLILCRRPPRGGRFGPKFAAAVALDAQGLLLREIGERLGVSRQRVHQIVKRAATLARAEKGA